jgi:hypothetical protein
MYHHILRSPLINVPVQHAVAYHHPKKALEVGDLDRKIYTKQLL